MSQLGFRTTHPHDDGDDRRRGRRAVLLAMLAVVTLVGLVAAIGLRWLAATPDYAGPGQGEVLVEVRAGDSARRIGQTLEQADVVRSADAFVDAAKKDTRSQRIQPGSYRLRKQMKAADALALLLDPASRVVTRVTLPEGTRLSTALDLIARAGLDRAALDAAVAAPESLGLPDYAEGRLEGFLFPATYEVQPTTDAPELLAAMVARFTQAAAAVDLEASAAALGRSPLEIVTVASLLEAEGRPEDFAKIARVVYNRLDDGMRLQIDATVVYALGKNGLTLTTEDLKTDSPYNTYRVKGLPPGPINSPGEDALRAALAPEEGDWLYYVTVNPSTGETKFTSSYAEFLRFKAELKAALS